MIGIKQEFTIKREELEELYVKTVEAIASLEAVQVKLLELMRPTLPIDKRAMKKQEYEWSKMLKR